VWVRFFDDFRYDQLGLTCKLENDVCLMGGIEPARGKWNIPNVGLFLWRLGAYKLTRSPLVATAVPAGGLVLLWVPLAIGLS
jgi:hypothetical protein